MSSMSVRGDVEDKLLYSVLVNGANQWGPFTSRKVAAQFHAALLFPSTKTWCRARECMSAAAFSNSPG